MIIKIEVKIDDGYLLNENEFRKMIIHAFSFYAYIKNVKIISIKRSK